MPRRLHLIDIENLAGTGRLTPQSVTQLRASYRCVVGVSPDDHVVVACNPRCLIDVGTAWGPRHARYRTGAGRDGADLELLDVLDHEDVAERFTAVVIASGDGIFAPAAARLTSAGCTVTVASSRRRLAAKLALAAKEVIYLPELLTPASHSMPEAA